MSGGSLGLGGEGLTQMEDSWGVLGSRSWIFREVGMVEQRFQQDSLGGMRFVL